MCFDRLFMAFETFVAFMHINCGVTVSNLCTASNYGLHFTKFCKNISYTFKVMARTRFVTDRQTDIERDRHRQTDTHTVTVNDSQTDRQTIKTICLQRMWGHNFNALAVFGTSIQTLIFVWTGLAGLIRFAR